MNQVIGRLEALKSQHRTGAAVLLEAAQHFMRAVESQRDVECQDIDRLIRSLQEVPAEVSSVQAKPEHSPRPAPNPSVMTDDERNALRELRKACVRKSSEGGQKEILMYLQAHGARSIWQLSPDFYDGLLKICGEE